MSNKSRSVTVDGLQLPWADSSDPRRSEKEIPFSPALLSEKPASIEAQATIGMMVAGGAMMMRQKLMCWIALAVAVSANINAGAFFETTSSGQTPTTLLMFSAATILSTYLPMILDTPGRPAKA